MRWKQRNCIVLKDRVFAGVCGGIGEYLGVDPTVIRLLAVILGFTGSGVLAYIVAAILIPENPVY